VPVSGSTLPVSGWLPGKTMHFSSSAPVAPCDGVTGAEEEKCVVFPGNQPLTGSVDPLTGTIKLVVPRSYLRQLSGADASGRPLEQPAANGARFYDGTAFSFSNTTSPTQEQQTFLYTLDSTPAMDYLLP